ncbi:hypothetical protein LSG31_00235 [Fodinisporobacter ferrooxydans]|uniref:HTH HARE-type domain-containing protein n=1 Tax=Fodinisporobacter ferrooxydans TaxID=2901836 RepID=A0ABY4CJQ1_9BACL|nr:hypothetical protein LSG31_00235 [Alicyclobacillaceae bacterium MYW30-H2]
MGKELVGFIDQCGVELEELRKETARIQEEILQKQREYQVLQQKIQGLTMFLESEESAKNEVAATIERKSDAEQIKNAICEILKGSPCPLHYTEILDFLTVRGYTIPGKDKKQNLLSYLSRDPRFQRGENRGTYTIVEDYVNSENFTQTA